MGCTSINRIRTVSKLLDISGTTPRTVFRLRESGGQFPEAVRVVVDRLTGWASTAIKVQRTAGPTVYDFTKALTIAAPSSPAMHAALDIPDTTLDYTEELVFSPTAAEAGLVRISVTIVAPATQAQE